MPAESRLAEGIARCASQCGRAIFGRPRYCCYACRVCLGKHTPKCDRSHAFHEGILRILDATVVIVDGEKESVALANSDFLGLMRESFFRTRKS